MTNIERFVSMLQQMAIFFTVGQITAVIANISNANIGLYVFAMDNGEYWIVRQHFVGSSVELFKYPPPVPSIPQIFELLGSPDTLNFDWYPEDLNTYVKENGGGETLYLPDHANDN